MVQRKKEDWKKGENGEKRESIFSSCSSRIDKGKRVGGKRGKPHHHHSQPSLGSKINKEKRNLPPKKKKNPTLPVLF